MVPERVMVGIVLAMVSRHAHAHDQLPDPSTRMRMSSGVRHSASPDPLAGADDVNDAG